MIPGGRPGFEKLAVRGIRGSSGMYPAPWPATRSASRSCSLRVSLLVGADRGADVYVVRTIKPLTAAAAHPIL